MHAYCQYHGIGIIPWSPLAGGLLARPLNSENTPRSRVFSLAGSSLSRSDMEIIKRVEEIAAKRGWKMSQVRGRPSLATACTS